MGRTYDLLRQAEATIQKRCDREKQLFDMEFHLSRLGLGEDQIAKQKQNEIRQSMILLNRFIEKPERLFNLALNECGPPPTDFAESVTPVLLDRKKYALLRYDALINQEKFEQIRLLAGKITDENIRTPIEANLLQLAIKDQIFKKEYRKLDNIKYPKN